MPVLPLLEDLGDIKNKRVLLRSDLNVPIQDGIIQDEHRILNSLPTIQHLQAAGALVSVCSHLGRPTRAQDLEFSMAPVQKRMSELIDDVEVMENLRFNQGETDCSPEFINELIAEKDIYVNDAFGSCHRAHASIVGPPQHLPSAAGILLQKEVSVLTQLLDNSQKNKQLVVIMGGAKVSDKLGVIKSLLETASALAIGGAMAFSFLVAKGEQIQSELVEKNQIENLAQLLDSKLGEKLHLPEDLTALAPDGTVHQIGTNLPEGWEARDIGPGTAASFCELIESADSIFWNGPMGVFEDPRFAAGTKTVAESIANTNAFTIVGGGDSAAAIRGWGLESEIDHLSTGGGATLEYLEKGTLVGIEALTQ